MINQDKGASTSRSLEGWTPNGSVTGVSTGLCLEPPDSLGCSSSASLGGLARSPVPTVAGTIPGPLLNLVCLEGLIYIGHGYLIGVTMPPDDTMLMACWTLMSTSCTPSVGTTPTQPELGVGAVVT